MNYGFLRVYALTRLFCLPRIEKGALALESGSLNSSPKFATILLCDPGCTSFFLCVLVSPCIKRSGWLIISYSLPRFWVFPKPGVPTRHSDEVMTHRWGSGLDAPAIESWWQLSQTSLAQPSCPGALGDSRGSFCLMGLSLMTGSLISCAMGPRPLIPLLVPGLVLRRPRRAELGRGGPCFILFSPHFSLCQLPSPPKPTET